MSYGPKEILPFDHVMRVFPDGTIGDADDLYAPELTADSDADGSHLPHTDEDLDRQAVSYGWDGLMTGWTGQYGYNGCCMHRSEFVGGALEEWILENPGLYCVVAIYELDGEPESWAIAYKLDPDTE